jgi:hypothetical protein
VHNAGSPPTLQTPRLVLRRFLSAQVFPHIGDFPRHRRPIPFLRPHDGSRLAYFPDVTGHFSANRPADGLSTLMKRASFKCSFTIGVCSRRRQDYVEGAALQLLLLLVFDRLHAPLQGSNGAKSDNRKHRHKKPITSAVNGRLTAEPVESLDKRNNEDSRRTVGGPAVCR